MERFKRYNPLINGMKREEKIYQKWWFLVIISVVVLVILGVTVFQFKIDKPNNGRGDSVNEIKNKSIIVPYNELIGDTKNYINKTLYFHGRIFQVFVEDDSPILLIATRGSYEDIILASYNGTELVEGSVVDFWGDFIGPISYESVLGSKVTVPGFLILHLESLNKKNSGEVFSKSLATNTQNGVTLSIEGYKFEKRGDDWGMITEIKFSVENKGGDTLYPDLVLEVKDDKNTIEDISSINVPLDEILYENDYLTKTLPVNLRFSRIGLNKTIKLSLIDYSKVYAVTSLKNVNVTQNPTAGF